MGNSLRTFFFLLFGGLASLGLFAQQGGMPVREDLGRGVVAVSKGGNVVFVSWRYLKTDPADIAFNVYRATGGGVPEKLNTVPIADVTWFRYTESGLAQNLTYTVQPVTGGVEQPTPCVPFVLKASNPLHYYAIPMQQVEGDVTWAYEPNDASVGDLDGDGEYEIVVRRDNGGFDNAHNGVSPGTSRLQAYKLDGTFMWEVDLGPNIRQGAHYTHFMVYDFDGDGKAEISVRTSELTRFGDGMQIGDVDGDGRTNYVNLTTGRILEGPEFLSVIDGETGRELARSDFIARGDPATWKNSTNWGDDYGNRMDRFLAGVGWFDGVRPHILICRGYYARAVLEAWTWDGTNLVKAWRFDTMDTGNSSYRGQGNHNLSIGDVDGDGKDEVVYGAACIDDDGTGLYNTLLGHGDAMHMSDMDPSRPGLEVWQCHESKPGIDIAGSEFRDARSGELIFGIPASGDVGRAMASDIDPNYPGYELWSSASGGVRALDGTLISTNQPSVNFGLWWGGGLNRYLFDGPSPARIDRWTGNGVERIMTLDDYNATTINGTKANPCLTADVLGDWREEVIVKTKDNRNLLVFSSSEPTPYRFYTLMHDRQYRNNVATQLVAYNQPPHPGFYLGSDLGRMARTSNGTREIISAASQVSFDAGYDYDQIFWHNSLGTSRTAVLTARNKGQRTKYVVEVTQHGHVFRDSVYAYFVDPLSLSLSSNSLNTTGVGYQSYEWYKDGIMIPWVNTSSFTPTETGTYTVRGYVGEEWYYDSNAIQFFITDAPGLDSRTVSVRPNPSSGMFEVLLGQWYENVLVHVESMTGTSVFQRRYPQTERFDLSLSHCPAGFYLLHIQAGDQNIVKKLSIIR